MSDRPSRRRWTRLAPVLLLISVAVNLLLVGAVLGRWSAPHPPPPPGPAGMVRYMIADMGRDLDPADRAILERAYRDHIDELQQGSSDRRADLDAIRQAMAAEPFDRAALEKAMDAAAKRDAAERGAIERMLLDAASQMSAKGRHRLAGWRPGPPPPPQDDDPH
jgi:uncharacterized membrane protein